MTATIHLIRTRKPNRRSGAIPSSPASRNSTPEIDALYLAILAAECPRWGSLGEAFAAAYLQELAAQP